MLRTQSCADSVSKTAHRERASASELPDIPVHYHCRPTHLSLLINPMLPNGKKTLSSDTIRSGNQKSPNQSKKGRQLYPTSADSHSWGKGSMHIGHLSSCMQRPILGKRYHFVDIFPYRLGFCLNPSTQSPQE